MSGDGASIRIEVMAGGRADPATVSAIGLAVRAVTRSVSASARTSTDVTPGWRRAALREGVGGRPEVRPDDRG